MDVHSIHCRFLYQLCAGFTCHKVTIQKLCHNEKAKGCCKFEQLVQKSLKYSKQWEQCAGTLSMSCMWSMVVL